MWYASKDLRADRAFVLEAVRKNGGSLAYASDELKKDRAVVLEAVKQNGNAFRYASEEFKQKLKNDNGLLLNFIKLEPEALEYASEELKKDRCFILKVVKKDGLVLHYASAELKKDREVVLQAVKQNGNAFEYASAELQNDQDFILEAMKHNVDLIKYISERLKHNKAFILKVARESGSNSPQIEYLVQLDTRLKECSNSLKKKEEYAHKSQILLPYKAAQEKLKAVNDAELFFSEAEDKLIKSAKDLEEAKQLRTATERNLLSREANAKKQREVLAVQKRDTERKQIELKYKLQSERELQVIKPDLKSKEPILLNKDQEQLSRIPLTSTGTNTLYIKFPTLRLSDNPKLTIQLQGPGGTSRKVEVPLQDLLSKILTEKMGKALAAMRSISQNISTKNRLRIDGNNYGEIKECIREAEDTLRVINRDLEANFVNNWRNDFAISGRNYAQDIEREIKSLDQNLKELGSLQEKCKAEGVDFEANITTINQSIYSYKMKK